MEKVVSSGSTSCSRNPSSLGNLSSSGNPPSSGSHVTLPMLISPQHRSLPPHCSLCRWDSCLMAAECMVRDGKAKSSNNLNLPLFSAFLPPASIARSSAAMSDRPACSTFWQLMKRTGRPFASQMVSCLYVARLYQGSSPCMSKVTCFVVNFLSLGDGLVLRGVFFLAVAVFLDDAVFLANAAFLAVPVAVAVFFFVFDTVSRGFFAFIFFLLEGASALERTCSFAVDRVLIDELQVTRMFEL